MREPPPILNEGNLGAGGAEHQCEPASACSEIGNEDPDDLTLPMWEVIRTLLLAIVVVGTTALIASLV